MKKIHVEYPNELPYKYDPSDSEGYTSYVEEEFEYEEGMGSPPYIYEISLSDILSDGLHQNICLYCGELPCLMDDDVRRRVWEEYIKYPKEFGKEYPSLLKTTNDDIPFLNWCFHKLLKEHQQKNTTYHYHPRCMEDFLRFKKFTISREQALADMK